MTVNKTITLSHINYKGNDYIRIDHSFDPEILKIIRDFKFTRWSQENRCWLFLNEKDNLIKIRDVLEKKTKVNYIHPSEDRDKIKKINDHTTFMSDPFSEYSSLFISYSFKDKLFVNRLNESLLENGVNTFLWEKDATFGETLKNIMFENVHKYDRVLFIASENSLKSTACQYELTKAREKQDQLWKTIIFPIHIDNFLFEIRKENIRPKEKSDEYWMNICELREINSLDFTDATDILDKVKFDNKIIILLKNLRNN